MVNNDNNNFAPSIFCLSVCEFISHCFRLQNGTKKKKKKTYLDPKQSHLISSNNLKKVGAQLLSKYHTCILYLVDSDTSQWSIDFTPDLLGDEQNYIPVQLLISTDGSHAIPPDEINLAEIVTDECCVCLTTTPVRQRECCNSFICDSCFKTYLTERINQRQRTIQCPGYKCKTDLSSDEVAYHADPLMWIKFYRFMLEANQEPHKKICPQCSFLMIVDESWLKKKHWSPFNKAKTLKKLSPLEAKVCCEHCNLEWCFSCHAPWHDGKTCREFRKRDRLLKYWATERNDGTVNAHKCPKCRVGCNHSLI